MTERTLKYGCNPHQTPARIFRDGGLPLTVLSGNPGYINFLDALNGWQLVRELKGATGLPAAASFKHVSPAGAAVGLPLSDKLSRMYFCENADLSPLACAYARARGTDRLSSFGDFIALSDVCDLATARIIKPEVSDGVIAPGYTDEALAVLRQKKNGAYNIVQIDPAFEPEAVEKKQVFGVTFEQKRNDALVTGDTFSHIVTKQKLLPPEAVRDLTVALVTLKYTQSNSVCFAADGQTTGVGAGQQSRIHCTRIAGDKADLWQLRRHEKALGLPFLPGLPRPARDNAVDAYLCDRRDEVLSDGVWQRLFTVRPEPFTAEERRAFLDAVTGVSMGSDAFFPFADNIERAHKSGVGYIAQPGGSSRDDEVTAACDRYGIVMAHTGVRLFHH